MNMVSTFLARATTQMLQSRFHINHGWAIVFLDHFR